jgi:predicted Zn-dependent protease
MRRGWYWVLFSLMAGLPIWLGLSCSNPLNIDEGTEIDIGRQSAADIERQYGVVTDAAVNARVTRIGTAIAAVSERPTLPWRFRVLNVADVNAFALPGGPVYVTRGLLDLGVSDPELAGVIGHEVAHINQRHSVNAIERAMRYQLLSDLVLGGSSQALRVAADLAVQYAIQLPRSRDDEYESDTVGMRLAYNAGYPPQGMVTFLQRLAQLSSPTRSPAWMRTHPLTEDRIVRAQSEATQIAGRPRPVPVRFEEPEKATLVPVDLPSPAVAP